MTDGGNGKISYIKNYCFVCVSDHENFHVYEWNICGSK